MHLNLLSVFIILLMIPAHWLGAVTELPKTGQTDSQIRADDGELKLGLEWPTPRFTDNNDGTLTDNLSGLMWVKDTFCAHSAISGATSSVWEDSLIFVSQLNDKSITNHCNEYTATYTDWRAPNINELASLIRAGLINNTSITDWLYISEDMSGAFDNIGIISIPIWSSTSYAGNTDQVWTIDLETGKLAFKEKTSSSSLAYIFSPVRSVGTPNYIASGQSLKTKAADDGDLQFGAKLPTPRFAATESGTVIDKLTGLMWIQDANCATPNGSDWRTASSSIHQGITGTPFFENCTSYIPTIIDDDEETWRFPNMNELRSLIDYGESEPALDSNHPFNIVTDLPFWTSTSSNNTPKTDAWTVSLSTGELNPNTSKSSIAYTWPVRGPVTFADIDVSHDNVKYNKLYINNEKDSETIRIQNSGQSPLSIDLLRLEKPNGQVESTDFTIGRDGCSERNLEPNTSCSLTINFTPTRSGNLSVNLIVSSNALGIPEMSIPFSGDGLDPSTEETSNPNCFIATAAYGSYLEPEVKLLRAFRDNILLQYSWGKWFVSKYYELSPPIAQVIANNENLKLITQMALAPLVFLIKYPGILLFLLLLFIHYQMKKRDLNYRFTKTVCRILRTK